MNSIKFCLIAATVCRSVALITLLLATSNCFASISESTNIPKSICVVMDDNYPPYVFKDDQGQLKGIIVDQWNQWQKQTGIHVELTGLDWAEARLRMEAGEFDVIDTIFRNVQREKIYDFTKPYADIPVPIFFHTDISGISEAEDAVGFMVAAKAGDNVLDVLKKHGVTNIVEYPSYEKIIEEARDGKVKVFTVDRPPALYFLNKMGIQDHFRETKPLYQGEFHRAVLKGQNQLLALVEGGFAAIPKADYNAIDKKWLGASLTATPYLRYAFYVIGTLVSLALVMMVWLWALKRAVDLKTHELTVSEDQHRTILKAAMSGIWRVGTQGHLLEVNQAYCLMSGYSEQELLTMSIADLEVIESSENITNRTQIIMRQGEGRFECQHRRKDGSVFDVEVSIKYQASDGGQFVAFIQDITERKCAEQTLQINEYRFRSLFENAEISIWNEDLSQVRRALNNLRLDGVKDLHRYLMENNQTVWDLVAMVKVTHVNQATVKLFGANSAEHMLGQLTPTFGPNAIEVFIDELCAIWDNQKAFRGEADFRTLDGKELKTIIAFLIPESEDGYANVPVCIIDITEQKKAEEVLRQLGEAKNTFISTVAHELRTPLIAIVGYAELLENSAVPLTEEQTRSYHSIIQSNAEILNRLVDDLLDVGRIQIGHTLSLSFQETNLARVIKKASESANVAGWRGKISVSHMSPLAETLLIDRDRISQVLNNLLSNAIKYSPEGGTIKVQTITGDEMVTVSIQDQGLGMTPEEVEQVFERFYRAKSANSRSTGLGLGMTIVKQIIVDHGGEISISSALGEGTTVAFTLPRRGGSVS